MSRLTPKYKRPLTLFPYTPLFRCLARRLDSKLDRTDPDNTRGVLGREAIFCSGRAIRSKHEPQYVDAHQFGNRRGLCLQRGRDRDATRVSGRAFRHGAGVGLFRGGRRYYFTELVWAIARTDRTRLV